MDFVLTETQREYQARARTIAQSFETILTQQRIDQRTAAGYWTGQVITDYLDEAVATPDKLVGGTS